MPLDCRFLDVQNVTERLVSEQKKTSIASLLKQHTKALPEKMIALIRKLLPYCLRHKKAYFWGLVAVIVSNVAAVYANIWIGKTVDFIISPDVSHSKIWLRIIIIGSLALLSAITLYFQRILIIGTSRHIEFDLRNDFIDHLTRLSPSFYDHSKTGDILARATSDIEQVRTALGPGILYPLTALTLMPTALWFMMRTSWTVALISLMPMLLLPIIVAIMANLTYKRSLSIQEHFSNFSGRIQESITGMRVVKSYVQADHELRTLDKGNKINAELNMSLARVSAGFFPSLITLFLFGIVCILWAASSYITNDPVKAIGTPLLTKGQLLTFVLLYRSLFFPILRLGWVVSALQRASASMHRLALIWSKAPDIRDDENTDTSLVAPVGEIEFRNLTFTYPKSEGPVLHDVSVRIAKGKTLGIVGPVGSGKSTLAHLIGRLYDPPAGTIFVDGHDVHRYPLGRLRRSIAMVFQETYLFSETILANICFGVPNKTNEETAQAMAEHAASIACVDEDIEQFPLKMQTLLGERGVNVSGGQKQRLALARAVASDRPILILDDAFAAVDTNTEEQILQGLRDVMQERTTVLISHRISTVQLADEIIVMHEGRIAERGTHDELVGKLGIYYDIYHRQQLEKEVKEGRET